MWGKVKGPLKEDGGPREEARQGVNQEGRIVLTVDSQGILHESVRNLLKVKEREASRVMPLGEKGPITQELRAKVRASTRSSNPVLFSQALISMW
jgi:hypothetical protein